MSRCRRAGALRTPLGTVEVFMAPDAHSHPVRAVDIKSGEYRAMYALVLPDPPRRRRTEWVEDGGRPSEQHWLDCGAASEWCERIVRSTPRLSVEANVVTLVVTTITREQRWADNRAGSGTIEVGHVRTLTVRCQKAATVWRCESKATRDTR